MPLTVIISVTSTYKDRRTSRLVWTSWRAIAHVVRSGYGWSSQTPFIQGTALDYSPCLTKAFWTEADEGHMTPTKASLLTETSFLAHKRGARFPGSQKIRLGSVRGVVGAFLSSAASLSATDPSFHQHVMSTCVLTLREMTIVSLGSISVPLQF